MYRTCLFLVLALSLFVATGCTMHSNVMPGVAPLLDIKTAATYDVLGPAEGTASGGLIFGIIPVGGEKKAGSIAGSGFMMLSPVQSAALYNAIEAVPTADALLSPRWNIVTKNYVVYQDVTVTVKGKAIRYNTSVK